MATRLPMNSRERVRRALTCRVPDRIPMALAFWEESLPSLGAVPPSEHFGLDVRFVTFDPPPEQDNFVHYLESLPQDIHIGDLAQLRTYHEWNYRPEQGDKGPLSDVRSTAELASYRPPRAADRARSAQLAGQVDAWHRSGYAVAGGPPHLGGELFETAYRLRGFSDFMTDLKLREGAVDYLLDQLTDLAIESAVILARAGVDVLLLDDDVAMPTGMLISLAMWRRFFKPRLAAIIRAARQAASALPEAGEDDLIVFYHSDGDFTAIVPDLIEIGVNVVNAVQPDCMDALALKQQYGSRLALWGTVGTALLWDRGTPEQIQKEVRHRIDTLGPAGLLLCPAYDLDYAPLENIEAFVSAVRDAGVVRQGHVPFATRNAR